MRQVRNVVGCSVVAQAFPRWITLPSWRDLATGRRWRFAFAWVLILNGFVYLAFKALAREYTAADLSPTFKGIGTVMPPDEEYQSLLDEQFASWRLIVDGLVERPASYSLAQLRQLPARTQITRHDCVEGWSAIGGWTGTPLGLLLQAAGLTADARYVVFHCADTYDGIPKKGGDERAGRYYESIDLVDAFHPQTILAYAMNGEPLPVQHGAPLRLRVEVTARLDLIGGGKEGFWEDRGYEWYAGV